MLHLGLGIRFFDDRQLSITGARKGLIGVHLRPVEVVLHALGVAGVAQEMSVDHGLVDGGVDVGLVVGAVFGEMPVTRAEDIPLAHVDGGFFVLIVLFLFPVLKR